jgi:DNA-binding MarR family transcriptional regulator
MPKKALIPKPSMCVCMNVRRASRAITKIYDQALEGSGLKVTQFSLLKNINDKGPLNVSALAKLLMLDRTTLVRNLKPLESAGFIENTRSQDPRERQLGITEHGHETVMKALQHWKIVQRQIQKQLDPEVLSALDQAVTTLEQLAVAQGEGEL